MSPVQCAVLVTDGEENDLAPNRKKIHPKMIRAQCPTRGSVCICLFGSSTQTWRITMVTLQIFVFVLPGVLEISLLVTNLPANKRTGVPHKISPGDTGLQVEPSKLRRSSEHLTGATRLTV